MQSPRPVRGCDGQAGCADSAVTPRLSGGALAHTLGRKTFQPGPFGCGAGSWFRPRPRFQQPSINRTTNSVRRVFPRYGLAVVAERLEGLLMQQAEILGRTVRTMVNYVGWCHRQSRPGRS